MSQAYTTFDEWEEFSGAFEPFTAVVSHVRSDLSQHLDHGQVEQYLETQGRELLRQLLQGHLDYRAAHEPAWESVEGSDGIIRRHHREGCETHLETLFGDVVVTRRASSARGAPSLLPLDATLHLPPDTYAEGLRRRLAHEVAVMSCDEATARIAQTTGGQVPKRQSEEVVVKVAQDFEDVSALRETPGAEASDELLVLTTDGKGMVMHHDDLCEATRQAAARASPQRPRRLGPGAKRHRTRMATVASVYTVAPSVRSPEAVMTSDGDEVPRPRVQHKRVWASVKRDAEAVIDDLFQEA
jgi:hypothetical protein